MTAPVGIVKSHAQRWRWLAALTPLALACCYNPHIVNEQDAYYCESQGLRAGTDANVDCALRRAADREENGQRQPEQLVAMAPPPVGPPPPPARQGGVAQTTAVEVAQGATTPAFFTYSIDADCSVNGLPTVRIERPPDHGTVEIVSRSDSAHLSPSNFLPSCGDRKVAGVSVDYTPAKKYLGWDLVELEAITKAGDTHFSIAVHTTKPPNAVDQSKSVFAPYCNTVPNSPECN